MLDVVVAGPLIDLFVVFADFEVTNADCLVPDEDESGIPIYFERMLADPMLLSHQRAPLVLCKIRSDEWLLACLNAGCPESLWWYVRVNTAVQELTESLVRDHLLNLYLVDWPEFPSIGMPLPDKNVVSVALKRLVKLILMLCLLHIEDLVVPESLLVDHALIAILRHCLAYPAQVRILCVPQPEVIDSLDFQLVAHALLSFDQLVEDFLLDCRDHRAGVNCNGSQFALAEELLFLVPLVNLFG